MNHYPEQLASAYLAVMRPRARRRFEMHLLNCESCWQEVSLARRGRDLAESSREVAPGGLRDDIRAAVADAAARKTAAGPRVHRPAALAAAVVILALAGAAALGRPWHDPPAGRGPAPPATLAAVVASYRTNRLPGTSVPARQPQRPAVHRSRRSPRTRPRRDRRLDRAIRRSHRPVLPRQPRRAPPRLRPRPRPASSRPAQRHLSDSESGGSPPRQRRRAPGTLRGAPTPALTASAAMTSAATWQLSQPEAAPAHGGRQRDRADLCRPRCAQSPHRRKILFLCMPAVWWLPVLGRRQMLWDRPTIALVLTGGRPGTACRAGRRCREPRRSGSPGWP